MPTDAGTARTNRRGGSQHRVSCHPKRLRRQASDDANAAPDGSGDDTAPFPEAAEDDEVVTQTNPIVAPPLFVPSSSVEEPSPDLSPPEPIAEDVADSRSPSQVYGSEPAPAAASGSRPNALQVVAGIGRVVREETDLATALVTVARRLVPDYRDRLGAVLSGRPRSGNGSVVLSRPDPPLSRAWAPRKEPRKALSTGRRAERRQSLSLAGGRAGRSLAAGLRSRHRSSCAMAKWRRSWRSLDPEWAQEFSQDDLDFSALVTQQLGLAFPSTVGLGGRRSGT